MSQKKKKESLKSKSSGIEKEIFDCNWNPQINCRICPYTCKYTMIVEIKSTIPLYAWANHVPLHSQKVLFKKIFLRYRVI